MHKQQYSKNNLETDETEAVSGALIILRLATIASVIIVVVVIVVVVLWMVIVVLAIVAVAHPPASFCTIGP